MTLDKLQNLTKRSILLDNSIFFIIETPLAYVVSLRGTTVEPTTILTLKYGITLIDTHITGFIPLATVHRQDGGYGNSDCVCYYDKNGIVIYNQGDVRLRETILGNITFTLLKTN